MAEIRVSSFKGKTGAIVLGRIMRNTDLLTGLIEICRQNNIKTGIVEISIGSLRNAEISWAIPDPNSKRGSARTKPISIAGPLEFISGQGIICSLKDRPVVHFHGTLVDQYGRVWAGHFFQGGNPVHSTMDIVIHELLGVGMKWYYDEEIDLELPVPIKENDEGANINGNS